MSIFLQHLGKDVPFLKHRQLIFCQPTKLLNISALLIGRDCQHLTGWRTDLSQGALEEPHLSEPLPNRAEPLTESNIYHGGICLKYVGVQTLGGCSPVPLDLRTWKIPPGRPHPWCVLHWHRPRPSAWHWGHTAAALGYFHPCPSTSPLLAVEPAHGTTHPQRADTGLIFPSKNFSGRAAEKSFLLIDWDVTYFGSYEMSHAGPGCFSSIVKLFSFIHELVKHVHSRSHEFSTQPLTCTSPTQYTSFIISLCTSTK